MCDVQSSSESLELPSGDVKTFNFADERDNHSLSITIHEIYSPDYGTFVWPSAHVLAQFIWYFRENFIDKTIIELGSGTSLPGITAAKIGAKHVLLTDSKEFPENIELCKRNANVNHVSNTIGVMTLTWGVLNRQLIELSPFDYIISSDCFYDENDFEDIIITVSYIIDKHPNKSTVFYTSYHERCSDWNIICLLKRWQLKCEYIHLKSFNADSSSLGGSSLSGRHTIFLLKIFK